jgi:tetratricopeptide (TPR) repeat protein
MIMNTIAVERRRTAVKRLLPGLAELLRTNQALVPAVLAIGVFVALGASEAGFRPTAWYPAALFLLGILAASVVALGPPRRVPRPVLLALLLLAGYTVWSYFSIIWASQAGAAWDGANRTAMYLIVFALFALWRFDVRGATLVLGLLGFGISGIGLVELLKANGAAEPAGYFIDARLAEPAGYINANVALWTTGLMPCLFLASRREVPALLRGLALGGAGLLAGLALLGQSRGWALALPLALALFVALCPGRVRLLAAIAAVASGALAASGPVLSVRDDYSSERLDALLADATGAVLLAALALVAVGLVAAIVDNHVELRPAAVRRIGAVAAVVVAVALGAGVALYAAAEGSPTARVGDAWQDFKHGGDSPAAGDGSRFTTGGSNRYDFWSVAWDAFGDRPLRGMGAENFQEEYLQRGNSHEQPRYPHSLELGVLSQTGLVGGILLFGGLAAALAAALGTRRAGRPERAAAAAAVAVFAYWLLHASVDWFWEFPALTLPAIAMLGLATAVAPRTGGAAGRPRLGVFPAVLGAAATVVLCLSFVFPWLAEVQISRATETWRSDPGGAFRQLGRADDLNPLSPRASLTAATIALRVDRPGLAKREFREALRREPRSAYAWLELGAIAATRGERQTAVRLLARARFLSPRDKEIGIALRRARAGRPLDLQTLNRRILERARERGSQVE